MGFCFSIRLMYKLFYIYWFSWNKVIEKGRENCFINVENIIEKYVGLLLINKLFCVFVKF